MNITALDILQVVGGFVAIAAQIGLLLLIDALRGPGYRAIMGAKRCLQNKNER